MVAYRALGTGRPHEALISSVLVRCSRFPGALSLGNNPPAAGTTTATVSYSAAQYGDIAQLIRAFPIPVAEYVKRQN